MLCPKEKLPDLNSSKRMGIVVLKVVMEEIEKMFHYNLVSDSTTWCSTEIGISTIDLPTDPSNQAPIHLWFAASELGHPLVVDDNHEKPLHPFVGLNTFLSSTNTFLWDGRP